MGEQEDKEKAEKLAAAKKRVAQLQKKKKATGTINTAEKSTKDKSKATKDEPPKSPTKDSVEAVDEKEKLNEEVEETDVSATTAAGGKEQKHATTTITSDTVEAEPDEDEAAFNDVIKAASGQGAESQEIFDKSPESSSPPPTFTNQGKTPHPGRQPSISLQSKLRSTSFRDAAPGPTSPGLNGSGLARVEELERENKQLAKEAEEHEGRWRRMEEELEELREESASKGGNELDKLRAELESLKRQQQKQSVVSAGSSKGSRRESLAGGAGHESMEAVLRKEVEGKDSTISDMQLEISRLRSQLSSQTEGCETHGEQISALQASLSSTEAKLRGVESELSDTKKSLARASEKAMLDGTERTSKDTKIRSLEREMAEAITQRDEVVKKADQLEKKVEAMNKLHREAESRNAAKLSQVEASSREVPALKTRVQKLESENARLREKHKRSMSGGGGDEGLDELEDEERQKLERRIRELEGQVFDLQRGVWRDKRVAMQPSGDNGSRTSLDQVGEDFDDVDLSGSGNVSRRRSLNSTTLLSSQQPQQQAKHSGFSQVLNSGLAAFRGSSATSPDPQARRYSSNQNRPRNDSLLQDFDDDEAFDEAAFAQAQREEEARKMVEHVREVKKGLKQWVGWRLDLVDARRAAGGGAGVGEIFDI